MNLANTIQIRTPEGISFAMPLASPLLRFFAWLTDTLAIVVTTSLFAQIGQILTAIAPDTASALLVIGSFLIAMGYSMVLEWYWKGETVGKRLFKLRVVDRQGLRLRFSQIFVRNLLRVVDCLPLLYLVGGIVSFFSPLSQRLGDMVANTVVVVHAPSRTRPDLTVLGDQQYNSLRHHPHVVARLRQRISPQEAEIGLQALLRRDAIEDQARLALFAQLAAYYQAKIAIPDEALVGVSPEQLVRNIIEVVYR